MRDSCDLSRPVAEAQGADAEGVDQCAVGGAELLHGGVVGGVHEGRGAAVGAGGLAVRVLGQDSGDAHRLPALLAILDFGASLDLGDNAAAVGLKAALRTKGVVKTDLDLLIAATALDLDATLVTNDHALLDGTIPGLTVENWI